MNTIIRIIEQLKWMKPVDVKLSTYIDFGVETNDKNPKFKVGERLHSNLDWRSFCD